MKTISLDNLEKSIQLYKEKNNSQLDAINGSINVSKFIESKSILKSNKDIPIGTLLEFLASSDNEYYLPCDGSIYNIEDYPYLSQYFLDTFGEINIFGGDGITTFAVLDKGGYSIKCKPIIIDNINRYNGLSYETLFEGDIYAKGEYKLASNSNNYDFIIVQDEYNVNASLTTVTPIMTSDNTPSPYIVSASAVYRNDSQYKAWKAFNGTSLNGEDVWIGTNKGNTGWLQIDLSKQTKVNIFSITNKYNAVKGQSPKNLSFQGSNDGINFEIIKTISNETWSANMTKEYNIDSVVNYRFYRIDITDRDDGNGSLSIAKFILKYNKLAENHNSSIIIRPSNDKVHVLKKKYNNSNIIFNIRNNKLNILDNTSDSDIHKIIKVIGIRGIIPSLLGGGEL